MVAHAPSPKNQEELAPALQRRPRAISLTLPQLWEDVRDGKVRIPAFQRKWRWEKQDVCDLLDSIDKGYPIGVLLFWQRMAQAERIKIGPFTTDASARSDARWVVDGQQRLISIVGTLFTEKPGNEFSLCFDMQEPKVIPWAATRPPHAHHLPLFVAFENNRLIDWIMDRNLKKKEPAWYEAALAFHKRLQDYSLNIYVVEDDSEKALQEIFRRTNTKGKRLKQFEVFNALRTGLSTSEPTGLPWLSRQVDALDFGALSDEVLLRTLVTLNQGDVSGRSLEQQLPRGEAINPLLTRTAKVFEAVIRFLQQDAAIPLLALLPYELPLFVLAAVFDRFPHLHPRSRILLRRWLWRGASTQQHSGDTVSGRLHVSAVRDAKGENDAIQRLLGLLRRDDRPVALANTYSSQFAHTRLELLFLLSLGPRNFLSGQPLTLRDLREDGRLQVLSMDVPPDDPLAPTLAGRFLHPGRRKDQRIRLDRLLSVEWPTHLTLLSHGLSDAAINMLRAGDIHGFLQERHARLGPLFSRFIASKTEWRQSDRASLREDDEEDSE